MKKILYIAIAFAALVSFSSCSDFLNKTTTSDLDPDLVYSNNSLANMAILGIYDAFAADQTYSQDLSLVMNMGTDIEMRTGNVSQSADDSRAPVNYLAVASNGKVKRVWEYLYTAIERANLAIECLENSPIYNDASHSNNVDFLRYHAEARVLRALCYTELIRIYGNVPFKIEPTRDDLSNVFLPKTDRLEIMEYLIEDLISAAPDLEWQNSTPERVTQGFARGLAARLALYRAGANFTTDNRWVLPADADTYYDIAREQTLDVINNGGYFLEETFEGYFKKQCQRTYSNNETLFEIGFQLLKSSELGYSIGTRFATSSKTYGYSTQATISTTPMFYYSYHPDDERRDVSVSYFAYDNVSGIESSTGVSRSIYAKAEDFRINKWSIKWAGSAFWNASANASAKIGTGINYPLMRYSDILLMFAEADYQINGETSDATNALWTVRSRAIPDLTSAEFTTYVSGKGFLQAVKDERKWEFAGEGLRKFDLMRWNELPSAIAAMRTEFIDLITNWNFTLEFPTLSDGTPRTIPTTLFYLYDENNEDFTDINIDYALNTAPSAKHLSSTWMYGRYISGSSGSTNIASSTEVIQAYLSGIVAANGSLVQGGRPFQPIPSTVITDYNGLLSQDYGF